MKLYGSFDKDFLLFCCVRERMKDVGMVHGTKGGSRVNCSCAVETKSVDVMPRLKRRYQLVTITTKKVTDTHFWAVDTVGAKGKKP